MTQVGRSVEGRHSLSVRDVAKPGSARAKLCECPVVCVEERTSAFTVSSVQWADCTPLAS